MRVGVADRTAVGVAVSVAVGGSGVFVAVGIGVGVAGLPPAMMSVFCLIHGSPDRG